MRGFIPVVFSPEDHQHIPILLRGGARCDVGTDEGYRLLYRILTNQPERVRSDVGALRRLEPMAVRERLSEFVLPAPCSPPRNGVFGFARRHVREVIGSGLVVLVSGGLIAYRIFRPVPTVDIESPPPGAAIMIEITDIPPKGPGDPVRTNGICGKASGSALVDAKVVVYAFDGEWYVEPDTKLPKTEINPDGTWCTTTHPGYVYAALLVKGNYNPPASTPNLPKPGGGVLAVKIVNGTSE